MRYPNNPIAQIAKNTPWPIKTIRVSTPSTAEPVEAMIWISYNKSTKQNPDLGIEGVKIEGIGVIPDTYHHLLEMVSPQQLQKWVEELGWVLGSGYMYRWHTGPGRPLAHLWGTETYTMLGSDLSEGDSSPRLAALCEQYGAWQWEINVAYGLQYSDNAWQLKAWQKHDPSLLADGSRAGAFPGWAGEHPWLQSAAKDEVYESHYYYATPEKYNKRCDVLVRGLNETYLTTAQAAELLNVQPVTIKRWCQDGKVKGAIKPGRDWLIPRSALNDLERGPSRWDNE